MNRRLALRTGAALATAAVAGCLTAPGGATFREGFEDGLGDWEPAAAIGPEVDVEDFAWDVDVSSEQASTGDRSLRIWNEGTYDDGVTWAVHPVEVRPGRAYEVTVRAQWWSESESFNTLRDVVMRLGPAPPATEEDFPVPGMNTGVVGVRPFGGLREPLWLADGWREYAFGWRTPELSTDRLSLAVGTAVIWEGDATHYVDDIAVELTPR